MDQMTYSIHCDYITSQIDIKKNAKIEKQGKKERKEELPNYPKGYKIFDLSHHSNRHDIKKYFQVQS